MKSQFTNRISYSILKLRAQNISYEDKLYGPNRTILASTISWKRTGQSACLTEV